MFTPSGLLPHLCCRLAATVAATVAATFAATVAATFAATVAATIAATVAATLLPVDKWIELHPGCSARPPSCWTCNEVGSHRSSCTKCCVQSRGLDYPTGPRTPQHDLNSHFILE